MLIFMTLLINKTEADARVDQLAVLQLDVVGLGGADDRPDHGAGGVVDPGHDWGFLGLNASSVCLKRTLVDDDSRSGHMDLKISVLSSGSVLLDGEPTGLANLAEAIQKAESAKDYVLYYRENAAAEAPAVSGAVMNLIIAKKLAVSFSTKADFSDCVDPLGRSQPREGFGSLSGHRPPTADSVFAKARRPGVTIVTRSRQLGAIPLPAASKNMEAMVKTLPRSSHPMDCGTLR